MKKNVLITAASSLLLGALGANAASLQIIDGTAAAIPLGASNELLATLGLADPLGGFTDGYIQLDESAQILVEYFGKEARYTNSFTLDGNTLTTGADEAAAEGLSSFLTGPLSGVLDFSFLVDNFTSTESVNNGSANENVGFSPNFFASVAGDGSATAGSSLWLFLDDGGGNNDDDFDDMAVRLTVTAVPAPPAIWLLGTAVAGLAFRRFGSSKAAVAR
jgi:hypothetical protein